VFVTVYHKIGTTLKDSLHYLNKTTYAGVTGKVQGDFTIKISKNSTGNQATTGVTITEVDATNNAGEYHFEVSGTTGFAAATGEYTVRIYDTGATEYTWEETYLVTSDGTGAGTVGAGSFTATASDGRVTDGASALADATIRIRKSDNSILTTFTSSATGVWGPVYLDNGTYTIDVQKSGYSASTSKTIAVSGGVATGPLTDVALTAVSSGTGLTASDLWAYARRMVRNANGTQADTEIKQAVNDALDMIAQERLWPRYKTHGELSLAGEYSTGTIAIVQASTNVTLTGGTWPTAAASFKLLIDGKVYRIASRTSGTVLVLTTAWADASITGESYVLFRDEYTLPSDCMRMGRLLPGTGWAASPEPVGFEQILEFQNASATGQKYPSCWAIHGSGASDKILLYPYPSDPNHLAFWYYRKPAALTASVDEGDWDPQHINLLRRAIDYQMAIRYETCVAGNPEVCYSRYQVALSKATSNDKTAVRQTSPLSGFGSSPRNYTITDTQ